jgi:hypothetical protein
MAQAIHVTQQPVVLEGYQAVLKPSKFGYSLSAVVDSDLVNKLEEDRAESIKWAESKLKNPKRSTLKPEPWEEVSEGKYKVKFSWNEENKPPVVDTEGTPITDTGTPLYSGSKVKLAFKQKPYILRDGVTYGTTLKLVGIQVVAVASAAGVDAGDLDETEVAALFGQTKGFKIGEPNVSQVAEPESDEDVEDF